jgi:pentatricopeptide repeat protein
VGERIYAAYLASGLESVIASNTLIDMYGKCDKPDAARAEFDRMPQHDAISYGALLGALGVSGRATEAVALFHNMLREDITPTETELVCVLSACSHGGLVDEALTLYYSMPSFGVVPTAIHQGCVIDALARVGRLDEAEQFASRVGFSNPVVLMTVLGACRIHGDVPLAERLARQLIAADPSNAAPYIVLHNVYSSPGRFEDAELVMQARIDAGAVVTVGETETIIDGVTTLFGPMDFSHPRGAEIKRQCEAIAERIERSGHHPDVSWATRQGSMKARTKSLCYHSERIAIAYNLLVAPAGAPIRLRKICVCAATAMLRRSTSRVSTSA